MWIKEEMGKQICNPFQAGNQKIENFRNDFGVSGGLRIGESESRSVMSNSLRPHGLYSPWNFLGQDTGVDSLSLLQGIFPTQGSNPGLPHCRRILYQLSHKGSPRILEWVAYPYSSGSSWPRNWTGVSCIAGRFFTNWAIWEAQRWLTGGQSSRTLSSSKKFPLQGTLEMVVGCLCFWVHKCGVCVCVGNINSH